MHTDLENKINYELNDIYRSILSMIHAMLFLTLPINIDQKWDLHTLCNTYIPTAWVKFKRKTNRKRTKIRLLKTQNKTHLIDIALKFLFSPLSITHWKGALLSCLFFQIKSKRHPKITFTLSTVDFL